MPHIDLFNKTADVAKMATAVQDGTFKICSKLYASYVAKCAAEGVVIGTVAGLAIVGALALTLGYNPDHLSDDK